MNTLPIKTTLIKELEGKVIDTAFGWRLVNNGQIHFINSKPTSLENYTVHQLRFWLKHAKPGPQEAQGCLPLTA